MLRIALVDDHPVTLWGLRTALEAAGLSVVTTAADPGELDPAGFDVLLLDLYLGSDLPCLAEVRHWAGRTRVIVTSSSARATDRAACLAVGARAFVHKGSSAEQYVTTIHAVAAGMAAPTSVPPATAALSAREHLVLTGIAGGRTHDQIARQLGISRHTVDTYVKRVRAKMSVGNKAELTQAYLALTAAAER
jgi:two-component system, NarL family, nitrate/nitrite response regulator NarL